MGRLPRAIVIAIVIITVVVVGLSFAVSLAAPAGASGSVVWTIGLVVGGILIIGVLVLVLVRRILGGVNADLLKMVQGAGGDRVAAGLPGSATVLSVRDTGITINHLNAMMEVGLRVQPGDSSAPYDTITRVTLGRQNWGVLRPGMTVAVRIDPKNRERVAIDLKAGVGAGGLAGAGIAEAGIAGAGIAGAGIAGAGGGGGAGTVQTAGGTFQMPGIQGAFDGSKVMSTADILADGERGEAEIRSVSHTGATAAQMAPGRQLPPDEADDPMVMVVLRVHPRYDPPFDSQAIMRVPDGKLSLLSIGQRVPVAWPKEQPDSVTIDWPALR